MPTFNGVNIFGFGVTMSTGKIEVIRQENTFPGLVGIESLTLGVHGLVTTCSGTLSGSNAANLSTAEGTFRGYSNGNAYVLVDSFFVAWANVILETYEPQGRIMQTSAGIYIRKYTARFRHLTPS